MTTYWISAALLPNGPAKSVRLTEEDGVWRAIEPGTEPGENDIRLDGVALPGFANCHSHAFHRALRGRTQGNGGTFWTWRERMYAVAARLTPENYLALARATYAEMALTGMTAVAEFHYVHHQADGTPHPDANAMGEALKQAAREAGIRLTLLDTCYLHGGLSPDGHTALAAEQQRFTDASAQAWAERHGQLQGDENTVVGAAIHSVRAVTPEEMVVVKRAVGEAPLHAHVSEQPAENEACQAFYGKTPIEVLAEAGVLDDKFTAVHATHLSDNDIRLMAQARAVAGFCPTTERDLADGIGPARDLYDAGAGLSLGSDQHAVIDMFEEMRAIESHERLMTNDRGRFKPTQLLDLATAHASIGWPDAGQLAVGKRADLVVVRGNSARTAGSDPDQIIYSATTSDVSDVIVDGKHVVSDGVHRLGDVGQMLAAAINDLTRD